VVMQQAETHLATMQQNRHHSKSNRNTQSTLTNDLKKQSHPPFLFFMYLIIICNY
jgi:hypothetical protein